MADKTWTVDEHLKGKPEASVALFHRFVELIAACGPYTVSPSKSTVTFKGTRRGFAGARPVATGLRVYLDLRHQVEDPRVRRVDPYTKRLFVHHVHLDDERQLDETLAGWVREAYAVGQGEHLK